MLHPQAVLGAVTTATTPDTALAAVMATPLGSEGLYLDHAQARAVLDLRVHRFCAEQVQLIEDELAEIITGESAAGP